MNLEEARSSLSNQNYNAVTDYINSLSLVAQDKFAAEELSFLKVLSLNYEDSFKKDIEGLINGLILQKSNEKIIQLLSCLEIYKEKFILNYINALYQSGQLSKVEVEVEILFKEIKKYKTWHLIDKLEGALDFISDSRQDYKALKTLSLIERADYKEILEIILRDFNYFDIEILTLFSKKDIQRNENFFKIKVLSLILTENYNNHTLLDALVSFQDNRKVISFLAENFIEKNKLISKVIETQESLDEQVSMYDIKNENTGSRQSALSYFMGEEERTLLKAYKKKKSILTKSRDLIVSLIELEMFTLAHEFIESFQFDLDIFYLKCEVLLKLERYEELVNEISEKSSHHKNSIPFVYLKARAFELLGNLDKSRQLYAEVSMENIDYRDTKGRLN